MKSRHFTIPSKLKVGAVWYKVKFADEWVGASKDNTEGETFNSKTQGNVIFINNSLSLEMQEIAFIHEVLHTLNSTVNHEFLDSLAYQLHQVFVDNKMFR